MMTSVKMGNCFCNGVCCKSQESIERQIIFECKYKLCQDYFNNCRSKDENARLDKKTSKIAFAIRTSIIEPIRKRLIVNQNRISLLQTKTEPIFAPVLINWSINSSSINSLCCQPFKYPVLCRPINCAVAQSSVPGLRFNWN